MSESRHLDGVAGLKKVDMKVSSIVFLLYCLVAAGAFGIEEMIPISGPGLTIVMLILFPVFWAWPISSMVAELGAVLPSEGGAYVWAREALGEFWGFQVGWWGNMSTWLANGVYIVLIVGYTEKFIPMTGFQAYLLKAAIVVLFTVINVIGLKEVSCVSTILSIAVLVGFAAAAAIGFANWHYDPMVPFMPPEQGIIDSLGGSICICVWMFCGYESISNIAGEVRNPQVIPKGLLIAMPIIALSYLLPTVAGLGSVGQWENWAVEGEGAIGYMDIFIQNLGPAYGVFFLIVAILSNCSIFNAYIASGSRGFFVMADDHLCPNFLVKVSKKTGVPAISIVLLGIVTLVLCQFDFTTLIMATTPLLLYLYMALSITVHKLRKTIPVAVRGDIYYIKGGRFGLYFMTALPFVISIIALGVNGTEYFMMGFAALASGLIAYIGFKRYHGGLNRIDAKKYPINDRTKLAVGDIGRIAWFIILAGSTSVFGSLFLSWYEGDWGADYYLETYGHGIFSSFDAMIGLLQAGGGIAIVFGAILHMAARKFDTEF